MNYSEIVNSPVFWVACLPPVAIVMIECILFLKKSLKQADDLGISKNLVKQSITSSCITAIGPCLVVIATVLSLISYVGVPLAWMRNSIIGNAQEELLAANFAADGMGMNLNDALANGTLSLEFFSTAAFVMAAGMVGYVVSSAIFSDKVPVLGEKFSGGNAALLPFLTMGAVVGGMSNIVVGQALPFSINSVGVAIGAAIMAVMQILAKKNPGTVWIKEWSMTISMFGGMIIAYLVSLAV